MDHLVLIVAQKSCRTVFLQVKKQSLTLALNSNFLAKEESSIQGQH